MSTLTKPAAARALVRCAVYTRKSTEEGLEQEFNWVQLFPQRDFYAASAKGNG